LKRRANKVDFVYKCSDLYTPGDEYGIRWDDPSIGIKWPEVNPLVSEKDKLALLLKEIPTEHLSSC